MQSLSRLFGSPARLKLIRLFVFNPDAAHSPAEIADRTKLARRQVRRELTDLLSSGLIRKKGEGSETRYQMNPRYEHREALSAFVRDTTTVKPRRIIEALRRAGALRLVVLSGHFSGIPEPPIDLLVVGDNVNDRVLGTAIRSLEAELGREIRYASFATSDFRYRLGAYDRLLRDVFDYPHRLLIDRIGL